MSATRSKIIVGCSRLGSLSNPVPAGQSFEVLQRAVAAGLLRFDTAASYAQGDSERLLGRLQRRSPAPLSITTKAGYVFGKKAQLVRLLKPVLHPLLSRRGAGKVVIEQRARAEQQDFTPAGLSAAVDRSLSRLGLAQLPVWLLHDPSPEVLADPATAAFLAGLKRAGKVAQVGVALREGGDAEAAARIAGLDVLQLAITDYEALCARGLTENLVAQGLKLSVRQVLNRPDGRRLPLQEALPPLLADPRIDGVLIGISRQSSLDALLALVPAA